MNDTQKQAEDRVSSGRAAELRRAFDTAFARKPNPMMAAEEDFLAIRLGASAYALRFSDVAGLFADKKITCVPTRVPGLLGIAGFRGTIMPVYDLGVLLGYGAAETPRWLVTMAKSPVVLAFEAFDGHIRVQRDAVVSQEQTRQDHGKQAAQHIRELVSTESGIRAIIDLPSVLGTITQQSS